MSIKYLNASSRKLTDPVVVEIYHQMRRDFGALVEPFTLHSASPKLLGGIWAASRETELVSSVVSRNQKELIATAISHSNRCPYCVDAHTMMLNAGGDHPLAQLLSSDTVDTISDPELNALYTWATNTRSPHSAIILTPPFSLQAAPEIIGMAVLFHYINRMVSLFLADSPLPLNISWMKGGLKRVAGWYFSLAASRRRTAGKSLKFVPSAQLPDDLRWAEGSPTIAHSFSGFSHVVNEAGTALLADGVRHCLENFFDSWDGAEPGMSRQWVEGVIEPLDEADRDVARLILTASIAPYQVDEQLILAFRKIHPTDEALLVALSWGSFSVARRIGSWLYAPFIKGSIFTG